MSEILRNLPGSSICVAPADTDLLDPILGTQMDEAFTGGGYSAMQRAALLQLAWDHVSSSLDGRESAFELHANGGIPVWRSRLQRWFTDYNPLANAVMQSLSVDMPKVDIEALRDMGRARTSATPTASPSRPA
jgi:4-hydroxyphenylacetate 3-monooxygenase